MMLVVGVGCGHSRGPRPTRIAILPLDQVRLERSTAQKIRQRIAAEITALDIPLVPLARVDDNTSRLAPCRKHGRASWIPCSVALAQKLEASEVVAGAAGGLGSTYILQLQLIGTRKRAVTRAVEETVFGDPDKLLSTVPTLTRRLLDVAPVPRWYQRWWIWAAVGVAVTAAVAIPLALPAEDPWQDHPLP